MKKAFTLIELLVVIAIIALLSTLSVVALNSARAKSRDARRLSDIKNTQTALEMYFDTAGGYPATLTAGSELSYGGLVFLAKVPSDPLGSNQYNYVPTESGQSYTLDFTVESKAGDYEPGNYQATPNGILAGGSGSTPPETFVCGNKLMDGLEQYTTEGKSGYCWMTQSLKRGSNGRRCFNNNLSNCDLYGGLYYYGDSTDLCPSGWRLPRTSDVDLLPFLADTAEQGFIGYFYSKKNMYMTDNKFLMLNESESVFDIKAGAIVEIPWPDSAVSVRCIKE